MKREPYERFTCECGEEIMMVPHERTKKLAPITVATHPDGNIVVNLAMVNAGHGHYRIASPAERLTDPLRPRHLNHWSNCSGKSFQRRTA